MLGSEAMGAPPYKGEQRYWRPIIIRARSRPNLPSCESLYGLSRTGLRNALPEGSADPYGKSSRLLVGNHRRFIAPRHRRGGPAGASDVFWLRRDELDRGTERFKRPPFIPPML